MAQKEKGTSRKMAREGRRQAGRKGETGRDDRMFNKSKSSYFSVGRLADGKDERGQLHGVVDARRHAAERTRGDHEGVPVWL